MAITPGLQLPYGIQPTNPIPVDSLSGPFTGGTTAEAVAAANAAIDGALRFQSMEVRLIVGGTAYKYWYSTGTGDGDLVEMQTSGGGIVGDYVESIAGITGTIGVSAGSNVSVSVVGSDIVISSVGTTGATGETGATGATGPTGPAGGIPADYVESLNGQTGVLVLGSDTQIIYNSGGDLTGSPFMVYTGSTFGLTADMKIVGNLIVTGFIITSTGIQGDLTNADQETIDGMLMDGGEYS